MQQALNLQYRRLRLILGDQLNLEHSWFNEPDESVLIVVAELKQEASYVRHHVQKIVTPAASSLGLAALAVGIAPNGMFFDQQIFRDVWGAGLGQVSALPIQKKQAPVFASAWTSHPRLSAPK